MQHLAFGDWDRVHFPFGAFFEEFLTYVELSLGDTTGLERGAFKSLEDMKAIPPAELLPAESLDFFVHVGIWRPVAQAPNELVLGLVPYRYAVVFV
jgi:hypothetical protein